jgi:hypothetical protein
MNKIIVKALSNVESKPAIYTIFIVLLACGVTFTLTVKDELKLYIAIATLCAFVVSVAIVYITSSKRIAQPSSDSKCDKCIGMPNANSFAKACNAISSDTKNYPLINIIREYFNQVGIKLESNSFIVTPENYYACFSSLEKLGNPKIIAIADLNDDTESWDSSSTSMWKGVDERIFHIKWEDLYSERLDKLIQSIQQDADRIEREHSTIYIVTTRESSRIKIEHPVKECDNQENIGKHLLIINDSIIGAYVNVNHVAGSPIQKRLFFKIASDVEVRKSNYYYMMLRHNSFKITPRMSAKEIRNLWITDKRNMISLWDPRWNGMQERGDRYVNDYDMHINCWIPDYQRLLDKCRDVITQEIVKIIMSGHDQIKIMELGCGTGALTLRMYQWINMFNRFTNTAVCRYYAIDQSLAMKAVAQDKLKHEDKYNNIITFDQFRFSTDFGEKSNVKYDVIFGSLIFHFLIGKDWDDKKLLFVVEYIVNNWLSDSGCMVWADVIFIDKDRKLEERRWVNHMLDSGMPQEYIDLFNQNNYDMLYAPSHDRICSVLQRAGFDVKCFSVNYGNAFKVIKIARNKLVPDNYITSDD